jgi:DNA-binding transcriptional LysR family regulator
MDIDLARTFLAVVETGSFVEAARRVYVTQSTVSMRIKSLENRLGKTLFERSKAGATLTLAGVQFQKHALAMVRIWEQARLEISLPEGYRAALTVGGQYSLWDGFLLRWLAQIRARAPNIAIRTHVAYSTMLMQRLVEGTLDIGVMYTPESRPGLEVEMLFEDELVLVSSERRSAHTLGRNYIFIDWGPEFQADHSLNFPDLSTPGLQMELGSLGLRYLLDNKGTGYFPKRLIRPYVESGALRLVSQAPVFHYPAYVVFATGGDQELLSQVLDTLRRTARSES